jgi:hypothetical protein
LACHHCASDWAGALEEVLLLLELLLVDELPVDEPPLLLPELVLLLLVVVEVELLGMLDGLLVVVLAGFVVVELELLEELDELPLTQEGTYPKFACHHDASDILHDS